MLEPGALTDCLVCVCICDNSPAADFLAGRSYQGLEVAEGETPVRPVEPGQFGTATGYVSLDATAVPASALSAGTQPAKAAATATTATAETTATNTTAAGGSGDTSGAD